MHPTALMYYPGVRHRQASAGGGFDPPDLLRLAGHPLRWRLLGELAGAITVHRAHRADRRAAEPRSYHLGQLRNCGLALAAPELLRRPRHLLRDRPTRSGALLSDAAAALHPACAPGPPADATRARLSVLFLCTGNSARSQITEGMLRMRSAARSGAQRAATPSRCTERGQRPARTRRRPDALRAEAPGPVRRTGSTR